MTTVNAFNHKHNEGGIERCYGCHLEFDDGEKIMEAMDKDWHVHCFRCYNCAKDFKLDKNGERIFALHKCKDGIDRPMHPDCSKHYLDQMAKTTVKGGWKQKKEFTNHITPNCHGCGKEVKGQVKNIPWRGGIVQYHLTCFKCGTCGDGIRDNDRFHDDAKNNKPQCMKCGGSWKPIDG